MNALLPMPLTVLHFDVENNWDTLTVTVGQTLLNVACESTTDWIQVELPMTAEAGPVIAQFEASIAAETASAVDIRLDDIEVLANYPCATDDPCLDGVCVVGACMTQPVVGCE